MAEATLYHELLVPAQYGTYRIEPGIYRYHIRNFNKDRSRASIEWVLIQYSMRVWKEDHNGVQYIKNCGSGEDKTVDLGEFFWVKLQAKSIT
jgi:hypothetical protein